MDKYAPYVFSAYGVALGLIFGMILLSVLRLMSAKRRLREIEEEGEG